MNAQEIREFRALEKRVDRLWRLERVVPVSMAVSIPLSMGGLRGYWPMSSFNESGNAYDLSGQARTLTYTGNPKYTTYELAPIIQFDGNGDYLNRADEAGLDILGTEAYVFQATQGFSFVGWFRHTAAGAGTQAMISKDDVAAQRSFTCEVTNTNVIRFYIFAAPTVVVSSVAMTPGEWFFIAGTYFPSASLNICVNGIWNTNVTAILAAITNSTSAFRIGADNQAAPRYFYGDASMVAIFAQGLSQDIINTFWAYSRGMFKV